MLNGELCRFVATNAYCEKHYQFHASKLTRSDVVSYLVDCHGYSTEEALGMIRGYGDPTSCLSEEQKVELHAFTGKTV